MRLQIEHNTMPLARIGGYEGESANQTYTLEMQRGMINVHAWCLQSNLKMKVPKCMPITFESLNHKKALIEARKKLITCKATW